MRNISSLIVASILTCGLFAQDCKEIFISEYVEGTWNNKAIELYNPTSEDIDLSNYTLSRYPNGLPDPSTTQLGGLIQAHSTFVIVIDKRDPSGTGQDVPVWNGYWNTTENSNTDNVYDVTEDLQSLADTFMNPDYNVANTMYFNGNDALVLENVITGIIDIFGEVGEDPGEAWGDENDTYWTKDQTLYRKSTVTSGFLYNPAEAYTFDPTLEWDSLPANSFYNLGQHICDCSDNVSITELESTINLYPNPNNTEVLNIESTSPIQEINIYNLIGQSVFSKNFQGLMLKESITIDPSLNGVYFISVKLENNTRSLKKLILK